MFGDVDVGRLVRHQIGLLAGVVKVKLIEADCMSVGFAAVL
jgi:hypothetical protein